MAAQFPLVLVVAVGLSLIPTLTQQSYLLLATPLVLSHLLPAELVHVQHHRIALDISLSFPQSQLCMLDQLTRQLLQLLP